MIFSKLKALPISSCLVALCISLNSQGDLPTTVYSRDLTPMQSTNRLRVLQTDSNYKQTDSNYKTNSFTNLSTAEKIKKLGGRACDDFPDYLCVNIAVPLDHKNPKSKKISIRFAVRPANNLKQRKGMLLSIAGGPGDPGIKDIYDWSRLEPRYNEIFDIAVFDLRGVDGSGNLKCNQAAKLYKEWDLPLSRNPQEKARAVNNMALFVQKCVKEIGIGEEELTNYNTNQAAQDIEFFRALMGEEKIWIYALSYGTQLAQTYAALYSQHLNGLVLDGVVDLDKTAIEYERDLVLAQNQILNQVLSYCDNNFDCRQNLKGMSAGQALDLILASYPSKNYPTLDYLISTETSSPESRKEFLSWLTSTIKEQNFSKLNDFITKIEKNSSSASTDESTLAMYFAFLCNDYGRLGPNMVAGVNEYLKLGMIMEKYFPRTASAFYGMLACEFWPKTHSRLDRHMESSFSGGLFPTLIVGTTTDAAVPPIYGKSVFSKIKNGFLVMATGEKHVITGKGVDCVDKLVNEFLLDSAAPKLPVTVCSAALVR